MAYELFINYFFSSRRRHTRCALMTGVQTCALPIWAGARGGPVLRGPRRARRLHRDVAAVVRPDVRGAGDVQAAGTGRDMAGPGRPRRAAADRDTGGGDREIGRAHAELQSLMRISYAVFCLKKKNKITASKPVHSQQTTN